MLQTENMEALLPHERLELRQARATAMMRMRQYEAAQNELDEVDDFDHFDYQYETFNRHYPGKTGSFMPFALRVLKAELPALCVAS